MELKTNSAVILKEIMRRKITLVQAAREVGLSSSTFTFLIRADRKVRVDTAGKLRAVFGDDAVTSRRRNNLWEKAFALTVTSATAKHRNFSAAKWAALANIPIKLGNALTVLNVAKKRCTLNTLTKKIIARRPRAMKVFRLILQNTFQFSTMFLLRKTL